MGRRPCFHPNGRGSVCGCSGEERRGAGAAQTERAGGEKPENTTRSGEHMKLLTKLLGLAAVIMPCCTGAAQGQVVISQVYGGGGNASSVYTNDFIELFNRG